MIKKFIDKLLGKNDAPSSPFGQREDVPVEVHGIDRTLVDDCALDTVYTLQDAGFDAYIVGGAVRDLLLGLRPKDFDVATNATPEQVKRLFRKAFIIGRRFRIVHVIYSEGRRSEVIEVSTFRAHLDSADATQISGNERSQRHQLEQTAHAVDASGRVLRDNVWGSIEHDAARRDFTINAMYYDPETEVVVDFHHGIRDARNRVLRMIGDPATRYREDPVRIVRAVRFAAKLSGLGFAFEAKTRAAIAPCRHLLADIPPSRLFDEMMKLLQTGHAIDSIAQLHATGLSRGIYPLLEVVVQRAEEPLVRNALEDTDRRVQAGKPVVPSFLLACVLWRDVQEGWQRHLQAGQASSEALENAVDDVFESRIGDVSGRGRLAVDMREVWAMQPRFERRTGQGPMSLVQQPRFRAGFDFLLLRSRIGEVPEELVDWWETFHLANPAIRRDMLETMRLEQQRARNEAAAQARAAARAGRPAPAGGAPAKSAKPARAAAVPAAAPSDAQATDPGAEDAPAKKRRRRRRKSNADRTPRPEDGRNNGPDYGADA
jgi:poly(A) polymerase